MANIRVDLTYPIKGGSEVVFRSPVDCSRISGLKVNYKTAAGGNASKVFAFADAHGNNVGDIPHLFAENVVVKVILDVTSGMAFVQNADTNAYLEGRFKEMLPRSEVPQAVNEAVLDLVCIVKVTVNDDSIETDTSSQVIHASWLNAEPIICFVDWGGTHLMMSPLVVAENSVVFTQTTKPDGESPSYLWVLTITGDVVEMESFPLPGGGDVSQMIEEALAQAKASGEFNGPKGDPGEPGKDGVTPRFAVIGIAGGTEVRITTGSVEQRFTVKNGKDGLDATPVTPLFANSLDECTDTTKVYVLPDGYLYAYQYSEVVVPGQKNYTNLADPESADWLENHRLATSSVSELNGCTTMNLIPCKKGDLIRVQGFNISITAASSGGATRVHLYDANKTLLSSNFNPHSNGAFVGGAEDYYDSYNWTYIAGTNGDPATYDSVADKVAFVRFCGVLETTAENVIVTVNEEITETPPSISKEYRWTNTGHGFVPTDCSEQLADLQSRTDTLEAQVFQLKENGVSSQPESASVPEYWQAHLSDKIARIQELQKLGGKDCFSFVSIADLHAEQNLGRLSGLLARRIMDECAIRFALVLGDMTTRALVQTEAEMDESFNLALDILSPVIGDALLAQGNHDGAYGTTGGSYGQNFPKEKIYDTIFRKAGLAGEVHFCDDGYGYYVDDTANRVRYVMLSPHNQLGTTINFFNQYRYGQSQFDLMVEALTTMPKENWGILFASHIPPVNEVDRHGDGVVETNMKDAIPEQTLLRALIGAFTSRSAEFSGSYATAGAWDHVQIENVDFSKAKGNFIGYFAGHLHADCLFDGGIYNFPIITSRCDSKNENVFSDNGTDVDEILKDERVKGTITEQSFDVFTVNKAERRIYATKIGAGADREMDY